MGPVGDGVKVPPGWSWGSTSGVGKPDPLSDLKREGVFWDDWGDKCLMPPRFLHCPPGIDNRDL